MKEGEKEGSEIIPAGLGEGKGERGRTEGEIEVEAGGGGPKGDDYGEKKEAE